MHTVRDLELVDAAVPRTATFGAAATELAAKGVSAVAVLDDRRRVVGLFGSEQLVRGLFPGYLGDLHHTAFARDDLLSLSRLAERVRGEPVEKHMCPPVTVDVETSTLHIAERFLHSRSAAIAVVKDAEFAGMLDRATFSRMLVEGLETARRSE